jgi:hypothetical protein
MKKSYFAFLLMLFVVPLFALALLDLDVVERSFVRDFLSLSW